MKLTVSPTKESGRRLQVERPWLTFEANLLAGSDGEKGTIRSKSGQLLGEWSAKFTEPTPPKPVVETNPRPQPPPVARKRVMPPGSWLTMAIMVMTVGFVRPCARCKSRASLMDRAGWRGVPRLLISRRFWSPIPGGCRGYS
jgi:hypothetical protein